MNRRSKKAWGTASLSAIAMTLALGSSVGWAGLANCVEPTDANAAVETTTQSLPAAAETASAEGVKDDAQPNAGAAPSKGFSWKNILPGSPW